MRWCRFQNIPEQAEFTLASAAWKESRTPGDADFSQHRQIRLEHFK
jgi:hypothetical protein